MADTLLFNEVLEAAERLPLEDQESLMEILRRRVTERRRDQIPEEIRQANQEFEMGKSRPVSAADLMNEIKE